MSTTQTNGSNKVLDTTQTSPLVNLNDKSYEEKEPKPVDDEPDGSPSSN